MIAVQNSVIVYLKFLDYINFENKLTKANIETVVTKWISQRCERWKDKRNPVEET